MTAAIVYRDTDRAVPLDSMTEPQRHAQGDGDVRAIIRPARTPGRLWEREAEREPVYSERMDWVMNGGERDGRDERGPLVCVAPRFTVGRHMCPVPHSHGILRPDIIR